MANRDRGAERRTVPSEDTEPPDGDQRTADNVKGARSTTKLRRELSEEEFSSPGTRIMLLEELDRLRQENYELRDIRERFHERDKDSAVLQEQLKKSNAQDIILGATLAGGSLILGNLPSLWSTQPTGWIALVVGGVFVAGTVVARLALR